MNKLEESVNAFISRCFNGKTVMTIMPLFNEKYIIDDKKYIFNEEILLHMIESGRVKLINQTDKGAYLIGLEGRHEL